MTVFRSAAIAAILSLSASAALAHDYRAGDLSIGHPWSRATAPAAQVGAGYLTIENRGAQPDRLISAAFANSASVELHEMAMEGGVMRMRELKDGIAIAPGQKVELKPGGLHLMFMGLKGGLKQGEGVKGALVFERAGRIEVEFKVEAMGARGGQDHHHGHGAKTQ
jgi:periplasmic copper chaperone A